MINFPFGTNGKFIISSPGRSRKIVLPLAAAVVGLAFYIKGFYVMGKALSCELSCPCDRSCLKMFQNLGT